MAAEVCVQTRRPGPQSIKDNVGTGDQMYNTGGAAAMQTAKADRYRPSVEARSKFYKL